MPRAVLDRVPPAPLGPRQRPRSEEHTSELQSHLNLVCRLLLEKKISNSRGIGPGTNGVATADTRLTIHSARHPAIVVRSTIVSAGLSPGSSHPSRTDCRSTPTH